MKTKKSIIHICVLTMISTVLLTTSQIFACQFNSSKGHIEAFNIGSGDIVIAKKIPLYRLDDKKLLY